MTAFLRREEFLRRSLKTGVFADAHATGEGYVRVALYQARKIVEQLSISTNQLHGAPTLVRYNY